MLFAYTHLQIQLTQDTESKNPPAQIGERAEFMPSVGLKMKADRQEPRQLPKPPLLHFTKTIPSLQLCHSHCPVN